METQEQLICEQRWYDNDQLRSEEYWLNGKHHNKAGSARRLWHIDGRLRCEEYWLHGKWLTKKEWQEQLSGCNPVGKTVVIDGVTYRLERIQGDQQ